MQMKPQQRLEKLRQLTVLMDDLIQLGAWQNDMNMGIAYDSNSKEDITLVSSFLDIYDNLKAAYNEITYLCRPIIAEGFLTQIGGLYMIGDYILSESHGIEIICPPEPQDDDYGDTNYLINPDRVWIHFEDIHEYKRHYITDLEGLRARVRLEEQDIKRFMIRV